MAKNPARNEAAKRLRETTDRLPDKAIDRLLGYAEGIAAGVELAKLNVSAERT